jgi:hypothetical protein
MQNLKLNFLVLILFCSVQTYSQLPDLPYPDLPVPGMYELLQKLKVKEVDVWSCLDSSCNSKEMTSMLMFDSQGRIDKELDIDEGKNVPYEIFSYPSKNEIIKKYNAEEYWVTHRYLYNDSGRLIKQFVQATNSFNVEDTYYYEDSVLIKEEIVDINAVAFTDTIIFMYEYNKLGKISKKYNLNGSRTEEYEYDTNGNLVQQIILTNDDYEKKTITKYIYSKGKISQKKEEWYERGVKTPLKKKETTFQYDSNGLLEQLYYYTNKGTKLSVLYTYVM